MKLVMPWSNWFNKQAKKRRKVEPWVLADVTLEEELHVEIFLRHIIQTLDPNDIPDLISAFAKENYRLVKIINQACLLYTSPSPRDLSTSRMPSSA